MLVGAGKAAMGASGGSMLLQQCSLLARALSSAAGAVEGAGSAIPLAAGTTLVQFNERTWGAPARLPSQLWMPLLGSHPSTQTLAVVREPFASFDQPLRPLNQLVRRLGPDAVAVTTDAAQPSTRAVVDTYTKQGDGSYVLQEAARDLAQFMHQQGVRVALIPDVRGVDAAASTPAVAATKSVAQSTNEVLMVSPTAFGFNEQAAQDNSFMHSAQKPGEGSDLTRQVLREFAGLHHQLTEVAGVKVRLYEHGLQHGTPDACFPNNWFSTHASAEAGGKGDTLVLYPMKHPNRTAERRDEMVSYLKSRYAQVVDMTAHEKARKFFEGTGVLVIDRVNRVAYVDLSERADESLAQEWVQQLGYKDLVTFRSTDLRGKSVYHTNVMMAIGSGVAIVCAESVADGKERKRLLQALSKTHEVVEISLKQMDALCGNALELQDGRGLPVMAMSTQAYNAFTPDQRKAILRHVASIVHAPIDTLERVGGGGVRCTLAELF